jgi:hypothetical protein
MIVYDCEIIKAILGKKDLPLQHIEYCRGWDDHAGMGISCICAYDCEESCYRVFLKDNFGEFQDLVNAHDFIVGFNSIAFDNRLCAANGITVPENKSYDLLQEIWVAAGLSPSFQYPSHTGYGLDAVCHANFGLRKTGNGALAPVDWQRGRHGKVIDYCLQDVRMTKKLLEISLLGEIVDPRNLNKTLRLRNPHEVAGGAS